jgi:hypothetical protein
MGFRFKVNPPMEMWAPSLMKRWTAVSMGITLSVSPFKWFSVRVIFPYNFSGGDRVIPVYLFSEALTRMPDLRYIDAF